MRIHSIIKRMLLMLMIAAAVSLPGIDTYAGFGDFNNYDYSYDDDWDNNWDYSYDDDWGNDWNYSYNDYDSNGDSLDGGAASIAVVVIVILIVLMYSYTKANQKKTGSTTTTAQSQPVRRQSSASKKPAKTLPDRTEQIAQIMKQKDVNFTANDFISYVKRVYVDIQEAWSKRDLEPVRSVLHPNLYQQTQRQIEKKIADGIVNHLERIAVNTAYLTGYRQDDDYEYMTVYLAAQMIDYQVKEETGEVLYGDKTTRWDMFYKMTFVRAIDMQTSDITEEHDEVMRCPSCGAPIEGTAFGKCEYCGTVVSTGKYGWVLSDFGVIREDTRDEGIHLKTGQQ